MATGGGGGGGADLRPLQEFCEAISCTLCNKVVPEAPKTLRCLHNFCEDCLVRYVNHDQQRDLRCPTCNAEQDPPLAGDEREAAVRNLPTNHFFENFPKHVERETAFDPGTMTQCDECKRLGEKADMFCPTCRLGLCDYCVKHHRRCMDTEKHELVEKRTNPSRHRRWNCGRHEAHAPRGHVAVFLYCTVCRVLQCQTCKDTHHESGHLSATALQEYEDGDHVDKIRRQFDETKQMKQRFTTTIEQLEALKTQLEDHEKDTEVEIDRKTEEVKQALDAENKRLKDVAKSIFEEKTAKLNQQIMELADIQKRFEHSLFVTEGSLKYGEAEDVLLVEDLLVRALQRLRHDHQNHDHTPCANDVINFEARLRNVEGFLGQVIPEKTDPELLIPGLGERAVDPRYYARKI